ncbi:hypothetical protein ES707_18605 [subsurface metagenome]
MAIRTVTKMVKQTTVMKLSWKEIKREHSQYPYEPFTVHALMQSDGEMLGYVIKSGVYWVVYEGDKRFARTANVTISDTLEEAKQKLMFLFADTE